MKTCSKCGEEKVVAEFSRQASKRDGLHPWCKACVRAHKSAWDVANREHVRAYEAQYRLTHPETLMAITKRSAAKYRATHPERKRADVQLRRARIAGGIVEKFLDVEIFERDGWICQLCFEPIDPTLKDRHPRMASLDHIKPISKGGNHTRDNAQATHLRCNQSKNNRVLEMSS